MCKFHSGATAKSKVKLRPHLPGSRMGVGASSGSWASCPSGGRAPSPWIALSAGRHNRDAACACIAACMRMAGQRLTRSDGCWPQRGRRLPCVVPAGGGTQRFPCSSGPQPLVPRRPAGIGWKQPVLGIFFPSCAGLCSLGYPDLCPSVVWGSWPL